MPGTTGFGYLDGFKFKKTAPPAALIRAQERSEAAARERADAKRAAREEAERMELEPPPADPASCLAGVVVALHATKSSKLDKAAVKKQVVAAGGAFAASVTDKVARAAPPSK